MADINHKDFYHPILHALRGKFGIDIQDIGIRLEGVRHYQKEDNKIC